MSASFATNQCCTSNLRRGAAVDVDGGAGQRGTVLKGQAAALDCGGAGVGLRRGERGDASGSGAGLVEVDRSTDNTAKRARSGRGVIDEVSRRSAGNGAAPAGDGINAADGSDGLVLAIEIKGAALVHDEVFNGGNRGCRDDQQGIGHSAIEDDFSPVL